MPGNIGASARAIKTMGFKDLRLVNPGDHLGPEARMMAHASGEILESAGLFHRLEEALADLDLSIATTAKTRDARVEYLPCASLPEIIRSKGRGLGGIGIVFGREESGLSNHEIRMCDLASTIPLKQPYPSLNLAQSVMIYAYTLAGLAPVTKEMRSMVPDSNAFPTMMERSKGLLKKLEIDRNPALYNRILERIALLEEDDIHLLLSVLGRLG